MVPRLFHVGSEPVDRFVPRPSPEWSSRPGVPLVWAVDEDHLWLRLLPRQCHRVHATTADGERHVWVTPTCRERSQRVRLHLHELPNHGFTVEDHSAGYWVASHPVSPIDVRTVPPLTELAAHGVSIRSTDDIDGVVDRVTATEHDWSVIRAPDVTPW